jgi:hypothetical protein
MKDRLKQFSVVLTVMTFLFSSAAFAATDAGKKGALKGRPHRHHTLPSEIEIPVKLKQLKSERHPDELKYEKENTLKHL